MLAKRNGLRAVTSAYIGCMRGLGRRDKVVSVRGEELCEVAQQLPGFHRIRITRVQFGA